MFKSFTACDTFWMKDSRSFSDSLWSHSKYAQPVSSVREDGLLSACRANCAGTGCRALVSIDATHLRNMKRVGITIQRSLMQ